MNCKNKNYYDWVCLCPNGNKSAKQHLCELYNSWLSEYARKKAKEMGESLNTTEEEAVLYIKELEESANDAYSLWKHCQ